MKEIDPRRGKEIDAAYARLFSNSKYGKVI
jgi:hypothetical protein